ncbi:MAG: flagellar hook-basal body complex protein FliE [Acetobacteraceae bacterium]|jgi:flagellar hook-basal body complex protein FliE
MTTINPASAGAAAAYRAATEAPGEGVSFGAALTRALEHTVEASRNADTTAAAAMTGQGSVTDVVIAVGRAEVALQTAVAVRDRVVSAYQDIMRMPI